MFAKLAALILAFGFCAIAVLAIRQMRTQAAHDLTEARLRVMQRDNELWRVRTRIAEGVAPKRVEQMAAKMSDLQPIKPELAGGPLLKPSDPASPASVGTPRVAGVPGVERQQP